MHPQLEFADIVMRMRPDFEPRTVEGDRRVRNALNMRCSRKCYPAYNLISWYGRALECRLSKRDMDASERQGTLAKMKGWNRQNNSSRGLTPGVRIPSLLDHPENRVPLPAMTVKELTRQFRGRQVSALLKQKGISKSQSPEDYLSQNDTDLRMTPSAAQNPKKHQMQGSGLEQQQHPKRVRGNAAVIRDSLGEVQCLSTVAPTQSLQDRRSHVKTTAPVETSSWSGKSGITKELAGWAKCVEQEGQPK